MSAEPATRIERVLDLGRWAPSGDNAQSWRFKLTGPDACVVYGYDTRDHCVYDLDGRASLLALGCLLATLRVAATVVGAKAEFEPIEDCPASLCGFRLQLRPDPDSSPDPWVGAVTQRTVQRRPMSRRALGSAVKAQLEAAVGAEFELVFIEAPAQRWQLARLLFLSAHIRLTTPECYATHARIFDWGARYSEARIPDQAAGLDALTTRLMRWAMGSWSRIDFMNRYLAGTLMPRLQLDLLPALCCGAHFLLLPKRASEVAADWIAAGEAWQRLWLEATRLGLYSQPEMTPLIFSRYHREGLQFSALMSAADTARQVNDWLGILFGQEIRDRAVVLGRLGYGPAPQARSLRRPLSQLLVQDVREVPGHAGA